MFQKGFQECPDIDNGGKALKRYDACENIQVRLLPGKKNPANLRHEIRSLFLTGTSE
jgi:hypothetical protein